MPVQYKDYYATLGVPKGSPKDEIRKAFRRLARQHHPDVAKDKKSAEAKFKEINEAYEVLGDDDKRKRYDQLGANWDQEGFPPQTGGGFGRGARGGGAGGFGAGGSFGGTGFSDFFEQFFSGGTGRGVRKGGNSFPGFETPEEARGGDIQADLLVSIEEALHGAKKKISFKRDEKSRVENFEVRIPKGVHEGQKIRLAGQGQTGGRGPAGDLLLVVRFERHPDYRIEGSDLIYDAAVPAWTAVLGGEVEVPTPDGKMKLKVPAGSQPSRKFRLKGRGLPASPTARGDFFVRLEVTLPTELSEAERELWEKLAGRRPGAREQENTDASERL